MDAIFFLDPETRSLVLQSLAQTIGCIHICLWSYVPCSHIFCIDGWYSDHSNQASSSSSGSPVQILFNDYRQTQHAIHKSFEVPGLALKEGIPYIELNEVDLLRRTSNETQREFYQQAGIKSAAFLSCRSGEIEIGMSTQHPGNVKKEIDNWFRLQSRDRPYSSTSSLRTSSVSSQDSSQLFYTMPTSTTLLLPHQQQTVEANYNNLPIQNINPEYDDAEIKKAMLAVISSPSSSASSQNSGAFKEYTSAVAPTSQMKSSSAKQNMLKRSMSIMRNIHLSLRDELTDDIPHTSSSQLHHKISERRRREKLHQSFQELQSLLPPGSKKDQASVLSNTLEYLRNLKIEVMDLKQKNELLEARDLNAASEQLVWESSDEKEDVQIISVPSESTSEEEEIKLQVTGRGDSSITDLILDILKYLKLVNEATLLSIDADSKLIQTKAINRINFRLKIKKGEWDQAAFREAINRVVTDLANKQLGASDKSG